MLSIDETIEKEKSNAEKLRKIIETGYDGEISIEALFCDDTSAIKEAYERFENCAKEHEQLAEWLEELKALRNGLKIKCDSLNEALEKGKKIGYNKAIDDFVNTVKATFPHDNIAICNTEVIAEKLKEGYCELRKDKKCDECTSYYAIGSSTPYSEAEEMIEEEFSDLVIEEMSVKQNVQSV